MNSTSSTSTQLFHVFMGNFHSRRLLLFTHLNQTSVAAAPPPISSQSLDANVLLVVSILLCGLICSLGLNFIVRCALRCSAMGVSNSDDHPSATATVVFNRGVEQAVLKTFPVVNYSVADMKLPGLDTECVICLSEFVPGERLRFLPKCNHGFHVRCIDKWLKSNWSCPKCRHCLIETCQKIMGCDQSSSAETCFPAAQENAVTVLPMEPESMVRSLR